CNAVVIATIAAWRGRLRLRATSTIVYALVVCVWLSPATGPGGRFGVGGAGGDADGEAGRVWSRDTSSSEALRRASTSLALTSVCAADGVTRTNEPPNRTAAAAAHIRPRASRTRRRTGRRFAACRPRGLDMQGYSFERCTGL